MAQVLKVRTFVDRERLVSLSEAARLLDAPRHVLERLLEEEIIVPAEIRETEPLFAPNDVRVMERCLRLHEDLGVNWPGVAIIEQLLVRLGDARSYRSSSDSPVMDATF